LVETLAETPDHIIAGHDPITTRLYKPSGPEGLEIYSLSDPIST